MSGFDTLKTKLKTVSGLKFKSDSDKRICFEGSSNKEKARFLLAEEGDNPLICICCNPSTADSMSDDPTIRKIKGFVREESDILNGWIMLNLYPQRATNPEDLHKKGCENHDWIELNKIVIKEVFKSFPKSLVLAAWGNLVDKRNYLKNCLTEIRLLDLTRVWYRKGDLTKKNNPRHPLYLPYSAKIEPLNF